MAQSRELDAPARTLSDVTAALTAERGDGVDNELIVWSAAASHAIGSHRHDLALLATGDTSDAFRSIAELAEPWSLRTAPCARARRTQQHSSDA